MKDIDLVLLVHYDMFDDYIFDDIIDDIAKLQKPIVGIAAYWDGNARTDMDAILFPYDGDSNWPKKELLVSLLKGKNVLLVGGYKSLCIRELYDIINKYCDCYIALDKPDWLFDPATLPDDKIWHPKIYKNGRILS